MTHIPPALRPREPQPSAEQLEQDALRKHVLELSRAVAHLDATVGGLVLAFFLLAFVGTFVALLVGGGA
jgi:hypothetical protein